MDQILPFIGIGLGLILFLIIVYFAIVALFYKKVPQGEALVRTGMKGTRVATEKGMYVVPVFHKVEIMDISVKKIQIERIAENGLLCKDNMRADIKVAFFVRVNNEVEQIKKVAQTVGCARASDISNIRRAL